MRKYEIRFIDSFKFMVFFLDRFVLNFIDCGKCRNCELCLSFVDIYFKFIKKGFRDKTYLFLRKGVYFYDYMIDFEKFKETCLFLKEVFYFKLNECDISDEDYEYAQRVWKEFYLKNFGEYYDVYLKSDVFFFVDIFENLCFENYDFDLVWYFTVFGLVWDAVLKEFEVEFELFSDIDMALMIE